MKLMLYSTGVRLYGLTVRLAGLFSDKAKKFVKGRKEQKWRQIPPKSINERRIWLHAASLGEFEQGRPILEKLKSTSPDVTILLTFFSPSGFEIRRNYPGADWVDYLPIDTKSNAEEFVRSTSPDLLLLVKYEFWLNHLIICHELGIPVISVSAIFKPAHLYFNSGKSLYLPVFRSFQHFFVQNEESVQLLRSHNINQVTQVGDTRFDRVIEIAEEPADLPKIESFVSNKPVLVVGSLWLSDLKVLREFIAKKAGYFKIIVAAHEIGDSNLRAIEKQVRRSCRYSNYNDSGACDVLIIDNMGMLSKLYRYAKYAYVGGAFEDGLHNTLEAAVYGIPIYFGRRASNEKFQEAIDLTRLGAGIQVGSSAEMLLSVNRMESDHDLYAEKSKAAYDYVHSNRGASAKIVKYVEQMLS